MTIFRGPGGTGSATSDSDTTEFQEFLVQSKAARDAALAAQVAAELAKTNAETAKTNAETAATNASSSASAASTSASNAATAASNAASSATSAATSASAAAASAASINPADIVHISGTETITGAKTFSQTITGSITGNAGTATNGVVTTNSYSDPAWITSLAGSKVSGNISGNAANVTGTVAIANGGTGASTAATALSNLGAYPASNPSGYTTNTGTVTSVAAGSYLTGGTITTSGTLAVDATSNNTASKVVARDNSGNFSAGTITATSFVASSDESLKTNWRSFSVDYVDQLARIKHGTYDRVDQDLTQEGVSAQSLKNLLPHSVLRGVDGKLSVNYGNAALVSAIQLAQRVVDQDAKIAKLEALVAQCLAK